MANKPTAPTPPEQRPPEPGKTPSPNFGHGTRTGFAPRVLFAVLFLGLFVLLGFLAWKYITALLFAAIIAGSFAPVMTFFTERWGLGRTMAAVLACMTIVLLVFLPSVYILVRLTQEALSVYRAIQSPETEQLLQNALFGPGAVSKIGRQVFEFVSPGKAYDLAGVQGILVVWAKKLSGSVVSAANSIVGNMLNFAFQFLIMLLVIFTLFRDGPVLKKFILELSPLPDEDEELIINKFNEMNYVTLVCNGLGGVIQGGLAGIGFAIAGIGSALLWTTLMVLLAFIPLVGISFVYIPACLFLVAKGHFISAAVLFVYCTVVSLIVENWFKPLFMGNRVRINSMLVLFSILGGMSAFGMAGIFYGPLIVTIFLTFVDLYEHRYAQTRSS